MALIPGAATAYEEWRRDDWIIGDGTVQPNGKRREYVIHAVPPRFRCRAIAVDRGSGRPAPEEDPADVDGGMVFTADDVLVLAEFEWIDPPPTGEEFRHLMGAAMDTLEASSDD